VQPVVRDDVGLVERARFDEAHTVLA
jgi:hypothetical protein